MKKATKPPLVFVQLLVLLLLFLLQQSASLATKTFFYFDDSCSAGQETGTYQTEFGAYNPDPRANTSILEPFNECYVDTSTTILDGRGIIWACDASTGEVMVAVHNDSECSEVTNSLGGVELCLWTDEHEDDDGLPDCAEADACSTNSVCTNDEPSAISPSAFNVIAAQYTDDACEEPTGVEHVVLGSAVSAPGFSTEACFLGEVGTIGLPYLSECLPDGKVLMHIFGVGDDACEGELYAEVLTTFASDWPREPDWRFIADRLSRIVTSHSCFPVDGLYYRAMSCTMDVVTIGEATTPTTAPATPSPSTSSTPAVEPATTVAPSTGVPESQVPVTGAPVSLSAEPTPAPASAREIAPVSGSPAPTTISMTTAPFGAEIGTLSPSGGNSQETAATTTPAAGVEAGVNAAMRSVGSGGHVEVVTLSFCGLVTLFWVTGRVL